MLYSVNYIMLLYLAKKYNTPITYLLWVNTILFDTVFKIILIQCNCDENQLRTVTILTILL